MSQSSEEMSDLDNLMNSSAVSMPLIGQSLHQQQLGQQSSEIVGSVSAAVTAVNTSADAVNDVLSYNELNCETLAFNTNNNQLLNSLITENSFKTDESLTDRQPTELTFSDLTPPVPNVSTLESNRLLSVDTSLPTVDGVSGAVPEPKSVLIQKMSSIATDAPSIEIPSNDTLVPSMAPKDAQTLMTEMADNQYSNIFQPIINGPSGSAPQTPAPSPIAAMETNVQTVPAVNPNETGVDTQQMPGLNSFESSTASFANNNVGPDVYNVPISQMVSGMTSTVSTVTTEGIGPLPVLGIEPALQEQLLDAIPPPSVNFPPGPVPTDEKGIPSALPGEFPLSLPAVEEEKVGGIESASVPLDKIEATINMNAKPIPTLTDAISVPQSEVNLIKSLPHSPQQSTGSQLSAEHNFNLNYTNPLQTSVDQQPVYSTTGLSQQTIAANQLTGQSNQSQSTQSTQQTSPTLQKPIPQNHTLQTLTTLQPSQSILAPDNSVQSQPIVSTSLVNVPEVQLPPPPAPPSATSIGIFETNSNGLMSEMVSQNQMTNVLPPPPPLQPVQTVNQSNSMPEMNTLTNLVPVVEPSDPSLRQPLSVVIKTEPQPYNEKESPNNNSIKMNDDNNNPILNNSINNKDSVIAANAHQPSLITELRGFPLCVISTAPTNFVSKNKTIVSPKYELTLPPKKAKFTSSGLMSVTQQLSSHPLKSMSTSQAVPSTGMLYDLPHHTSEHSINNSSTFRVQSGQQLKLSHNMTPPFTTVSPILLQNLMPSVSVIDGPLSLVKEEKMRQLISANHPDYPAISGLLSFISPYHKPLTTSAVTTGHSSVCAEVPLSLSVKTNLSSTPITANSLSHSHSSSHVPSLTRPSIHQINQSITSASNIVHTPPTAVPVSVVTSVVDHNRGFTQRIKTVGQNSTKNKIIVEHNPPGGTGVKLQLAPLLSGDPAKPFQCALCGKHLASKNVYQLHLRSHSGEKPFSCNLCGHSFSQKTSLTRHMRSHTGERPFPCQVCGKRFADKERIKIHMRTHTGEKPFACDICGKQFSQKSTVKRHMSVHTGEKPFKCETCGKGFANRGNLTAHTKTHSNS